MATGIVGMLLCTHGSISGSFRTYCFSQNHGDDLIHLSCGNRERFTDSRFRKVTFDFLLVVFIHVICILIPYIPDYFTVKNFIHGCGQVSLLFFSSTTDFGLFSELF